MSCPYCGRANRSGARFCVGCGNVLNAQPVRQYAQPVQQPNSQVQYIVVDNTPQQSGGGVLGFIGSVIMFFFQILMWCMRAGLEIMYMIARMF